MAESWIVRSEVEKRNFINFLTRLNVTEPMEFNWGKHKAKRSLSANNLYWQWMSRLANYFSKKGGDYDKDMMHDLMRHKFLGYETKTIGRTTIEAQLKTTTKMKVPEFCAYMLQVDLWAQEHGCNLPRPDDNLYAQYYQDNQ